VEEQTEFSELDGCEVLRWFVEGEKEGVEEDENKDDLLNFSAFFKNVKKLLTSFLRCIKF
jgi:hypothetical protein